jgi:hypothetical protein
VVGAHGFARDCAKLDPGDIGQMYAGHEGADTVVGTDAVESLLPLAERDHFVLLTDIPGHNPLYRPARLNQYDAHRLFPLLPQSFVVEDYRR